MAHRVSIVTGGAGFIAATLVPRLLSEGRTVVAADDLSRGRREHLDLAGAEGSDRIVFAELDVSRRDRCDALFERASALGAVDEVWHLAANSDIPAGGADPDIDLKDTFLTTFEVLRAMRAHRVPALHFASSSAVYGDHGDAVLHETTGPTLPISNYGAMKLASEAQAAAAGEAFLRTVNLFRFPNVVGVPATHGVLLDFVRKLKLDRHRLEVLGDGTQQKAYLHVTDLVDAMFFVRNRESAERTRLVNVGPADDGVRVSWIAEQVVARVSPTARIVYGEGGRGWVGDVPRFRYSIETLRSLGWTPSLDSATAVRRAIAEIADQEGVPPGAMTP